jgi:Na+-transporting NADH:ubiquinone oxidoreductase subunit NqrB
MRELLREVFEPNRWNVAAGGLVVVLLFVAYVLVPQPLVQYSVWLVIFTVWMAWFIYVGVDYMYGTEA